MSGYHIGKDDKPAKCRATVRPCTATPPPGMRQYQADTPEQIKRFVQREKKRIALKKEIERQRADTLRKITSSRSCHGDSCHGGGGMRPRWLS